MLDGHANSQLRKQSGPRKGRTGSDGMRRANTGTGRADREATVAQGRGGWIARRPAGAGLGLALSALALSGVGALLYEVCWIRTASLAFGSSTIAVSTVLAV